MPTYNVKVEGIGDVPIVADDIAAARRRAKTAFRAGPGAVSRIREYSACEACQSAPCACKEAV